MNIITAKPLKNGKMRVTVDLAPGEKIAAINPDGYYRMGYPHEDIVRGEQIIDAQSVMWCVVGQEWVE